jgi:hypothetical protein
MRSIACQFVLALMLVAPLAARADTSCNASDAQVLARQGYAYLDQHRWNDARTSAGELALYAKNCDDPKVGYPSVVHSAYIGAVALHGLGFDSRASQAAQMGVTVLDALHSQGGYDDLYASLAPKFAALEATLKP